MQTITITTNGTETEANITDKDAQTLATLTGTPRGSFAFVSKLVSGEAGKKGCERPEISDRLFLAQPRYDRFLARKRATIERVTLDVTPLLPSSFDMTKAEALFSEARAELIASYERDNDETAGQRAGQAINYGEHKGFRLHLVSEKSADGLMRPVLDADGRPTVDGIMVSFYEIAKTVHQEARYRPVNSRAKTIMKKAIERAMSAMDPTCRDRFKHLNLCKANFQRVAMNSTVVAGMVRDMQTAEFDASIAEAYRHIGNLPTAPIATLTAEADADTTASVPV